MAVLYNLGCKLNQYEGFCLKKKYERRDDVIIVNTCCVTRDAELKSVRKFKYLRKKFPDKKIIATGCACRLAPGQFAAATEVVDITERNVAIKDIRPLPERSRYFLKIQDGCNGSCTYCVVPKLRDRIESKPLPAVIDEIAWARDQGFREVVLVGANIGLYGLDTGSCLTALIRGLAGVKNSPRIRLTSIEPNFITAELMAVLKDIPFCRWFHIPIQSGDDTVLCRMDRGYDRQTLAARLDLITRNFPEAGIGADIIVGFPGEGPDEYANTLNLIRDHGLMHLHVFPYSPRPITAAYALGDPVPRAEKKDRLWRLRQLIEEKNFVFRKKMLDRIYPVTVELKRDLIIGLTDTYVRVRLDRGRARDLLEIKVREVNDLETIGEVVEHA